ncbi:ISAs1 family transposase [Bounagaea algeriensis]
MEQLARVVADREGTGSELLAALSAVPDPRRARGLRHRLPVILAVALSAVLSGARSFTAIGEWAADASAEVLQALGVDGAPPDESTIRRTVQRLSGDALDTGVGGWLDARTRVPGGRRALAIDGKTLRGSGGTEGPARHLMAAIDHHTGVVLGQVNVDSKTNEIPLFSPLCDQIGNLQGVAVTMDALHCQTAHAEHLLGERGAHYLVTVKGNQPALRAQLHALPWKQVPVGHTERGHGRVEKRTLKAVTLAAGIAFPHAAQAIQSTRKTSTLSSTTRRTETVYAVTSLPADQAKPDELAALVRRHWCLENQLHWVRDVTFAEDHCQIRAASGPRVMATLRNLAISLLRLTGVTNIAQALRHHARDPLRPLALLLMTS